MQPGAAQDVGSIVGAVLPKPVPVVADGEDTDAVAEDPQPEIAGPGILVALAEPHPEHGLLVTLLVLLHHPSGPHEELLVEAVPPVEVEDVVEFSDPRRSVAVVDGTEA